MTQFESQVNRSIPNDLLALDDAATEFGVSRSTLFRFVAKGELARFKRAGDRRTFVSRGQVRTLVSFKEVGDGPPS